MNPGARLVILGKQGAGKGTQAVRLSRHYVVPHVATGDTFRSAVRSGSEFGQKARKFLDAGEFVPDEIVIGMVRERLTHDDTTHRGFILDGFPARSTRPRPSWRSLEPEGPGPGRQPRDRHRPRPAPAGRPAGVLGLRRQLQRGRQPARVGASATCAAARWSSATTTPSRHPAPAGALRAGDGAADELVLARGLLVYVDALGEPRRGHGPAGRRGGPAQSGRLRPGIRAGLKRSRARRAPHPGPQMVHWDCATQHGRSRQDAQGRAGGSGDARRHPGRGAPGRDDRPSRPGGPRRPRPARSPVQLPQLPWLPRGDLHFPQRHDRARHPRRLSPGGGDILSIDCGAIVEGYHGDAAFTMGIGDIDPVAGADQGHRAEPVGGYRTHPARQPATRHRPGRPDRGRRRWLLHGARVRGPRHRHGHARGAPGPQLLARPSRARPQGRAWCSRSSPWSTCGGPETVQLDDGWSVVTADGSLSAHFEHTIAVTDDGPEVLTLPD